MGTGHAFLSPSGASIWMNCTPAARLAEPFADTAGREADEGTLAHRLGELFLRYRTGKITKKVYSKDLKEIQADELYEASMFEYCDNYAVFVLEKYAEAQAKSKDALLVRTAIRPYRIYTRRLRYRRRHDHSRRRVNYRRSEIR